MIGLWSHNQINRRLPRDDFGAFRLRHATRDRNYHAPAAFGLFGLERLQPSEFGINFLGRFLADVAGVQNYHVRVVWRLARRVAKRRQQIRHAGGIVDVHLAAVGFDVELFHWLVENIGQGAFNTRTDRKGRFA